MMRKSSFWNRSGGKSRKAQRGLASRNRRKGRLAGTGLSVEWLEDRHMLSANPVFSITPNQFFGQNTQFVVNDDLSIPFRANFTDVIDQIDVDNETVQTYVASIDWGDGSDIDYSNVNSDHSIHPESLVTVGFNIHSQLFEPTAAGDSITGQVEGFHNYATTGQFNVTVTLTDSNGGTATQSSLVDVYPVDFNIGIIDPNAADGDISERVPFSLTLNGAASANPNITSWKISWGDGVETFNGNPSSVTHTYNDDQDFTDPYHRYSPYVPIVAAFTGDNGTYVTARVISILDVAPVMNAEAVSTDVNEGQPFTITNMSYSDPADPLAAWIIFWGDEAPDVTIDQITILPPGTTTASHIYANGDATYQAFVAPVNVDNEGQGFFPFEVHVHNLAPTADAGGPYTVDEGGSITLDGSGSSDAAGDLSTLVYQWDMDNDGIFDGANDVTGINAVFDATGIDGAQTYTINLRVTDQDGASDISSTTLTVANAAPTADFSGGGSVNEGTPATVSFANPLDPSSADTSAGFHYAYDLNNDGTFDVGDGTYAGSGTSTSQSVPTSDGDATYNIKARIIDKDGGFTDYTTQVVVLNVAPTLAISGGSSVNEGSSYTLNLSSFDPGADTIDHWTINWGDSTQTVMGNPSSVSHTYADGSASYSITATATDEDGTWNAGNSVAVAVHNLPPTVDSATFSVPENSLNGTVVGTVTAHDPGTDTVTFSIVGGSGATALAINSTSGQITVSNGSLLDFDTNPTLTLNVQADDGEGGISTGTITINVTKLASISGVVYVDTNHNGLFDANEMGIDGIQIKLLDQSGNPVLDGAGHAMTALTGNDGLYLFNGLLPGVYQVAEVQPTGVTDGPEHLGSLGGTIIANDRMQLTLNHTDAYDYAFAEFGQQLRAGDSAGIGFWQNKNGQALIAQGGAQLGVWLTSHFGNIFGNSLVGMTGAQVATFYRDQIFKGLKAGGPAKVDAQFMALALATYFTDRTLAGTVATAYGFNVSDTGIATKIVNVGTKGAAFGVANGSDRTIMQLLLATNNLTDQPNSILGFDAIYDRDGNGVISSSEASLRTMANDLFGAINDAGGI
jgi:hypothetical protein